MINIIGIRDSGKSKEEISEFLDKIPSENGSEVNEYKEVFQNFGLKNAVHSFLNTQPQPFVSPDKRFYAFAEGEIYDCPKGNQSLECLFQNFLLNKFNGWEQINGQFVIIVYDTLTEDLHIINDRFGFRQFYYYHNKDTFVFGSQIKAITMLIEQTLEFSVAGLAQFIFFRHHFGDVTSFENILCLPPASILSFNEKKVKINTYWRARYVPDYAIRTDQFAEIFQIAINRQLERGTRKGILLSGGLDSRAVIYGLYKQKKPVTAFTFGNKNSRDMEYAKQVCSILGFEHHLLYFDPLSWKKMIPKVVWESEGETSFHHYKSAQFHSFIKKKCDTILTGLAGDMIMGGSFISSKHLRQKGFNGLVEHAFERTLEHPVELVRRIIHPVYVEEMKGLALKAITKTLLSNDNKIAADIFDAWIFENRVRRLALIGPASDRYLFNIQSPFFDYDLFDFSLKIPASKRYNSYFYLKALWNMMPELRNVPWQKTGLPPFPGNISKAKWILSAIFNGRAFGQQKKYDKSFLTLGDLLRDSFTQDEILNLLYGYMKKWHKYFNSDEVAKIISDHYLRRGRNYSVIISKLITINYLEELFIKKISYTKLS